VFYYIFHNKIVQLTNLFAGHFHNTGWCAMAMDTFSIFHELFVILVRICVYMVVDRI